MLMEVFPIMFKMELDSFKRDYNLWLFLYYFTLCEFFLLDLNEDKATASFLRSAGLFSVSWLVFCLSG